MVVLRTKESKNVPDAPFPGSYWVEPGRLLAGPFPAAPIPEITRFRMRLLLDTGIRCVINLMEPDELDRDGQAFPRYETAIRDIGTLQGVEVECHRAGIRDMSVPSKPEMNRILNLIDQSLGADKPVYVHCLGGYGRTGTVVGCYLVRHRIARGDQVLKTIKVLRAGLYGVSPQTPAQCDMVRTWIMDE